MANVLWKCTKRHEKLTHMDNMFCLHAGVKVQSWSTGVRQAFLQLLIEVSKVMLD